MSDSYPTYRRFPILRPTMNGRFGFASPIAAGCQARAPEPRGVSKVNSCELALTRASPGITLRPPGSSFCSGSGIAAAPGWDTRVRRSNLTARDPLERPFAEGVGGPADPVIQVAVARSAAGLATSMRQLSSAFPRYAWKSSARVEAENMMAWQPPVHRPAMARNRADPGRSPKPHHNRRRSQARGRPSANLGSP
jgi:hypothetical protein